MAIGKKTTKPANVRPSDDDEDDNVQVTADISSESNDDDVEQVSPKVSAGEIPLATAEEANASVKSKDQLVIVTMLEHIEPAPRIGGYDVKERLGKTKLEAKKSYRLPHFVAMVLVDAGKAAMINA